jgi:hypothetical protein
MNLTPKKLLIIITAALAGIAFMASCSKQPEAPKAKQAAVKTTKKGKKGKGKDSGKTTPVVFSPAEKNTLKAFRKGQYVTLDWRVDTTGGAIETIHILRSATGIGKKEKMAELEPEATRFDDRLPNENAHWYWLQLVGKNKAVQDIGPVKVEPDEAGSADYIKQEDIYKARITRTDDHATITWDFPENEYKRIRIVRHSRSINRPFDDNSRATHVLVSLSWKSQHINALPNPNSEYWYWFQITLKSGGIIHIGPVKAEYARAAARKSSQQSPAPAAKSAK